MGGTQIQPEKRGPGRPREERFTRMVLDAVLSLVTEQGVEAVTMDAVVARAEVSKPAIYRRWPTKQDLILAAAESRVGPVSVADLGDFRAELHALLMARLEVYRLPGTDRLLVELMSAAARAGTGRSAYATYTSRVTAQTRAILQRGIERGDVRADVDVAAVATLVAAPLVFRLLGEQGPPDARFVDEVVDLVTRAVAARS